jgi:hypothetical protein
MPLLGKPLRFKFAFTGIMLEHYSRTATAGGLGLEMIVVTVVSPCLPARFPHKKLTGGSRDTTAASVNSLDDHAS